MQVDQLLLNCYRKIRSFLTTDACKLLVRSLVMIRLDYCNAVFCGARNDVIRQLKRVQRRAHRVDLLVVPHHGVNKYYDKAFAIAGPRLWNELLTDELLEWYSLDIVNEKLKTLLFQKPR